MQTEAYAQFWNSCDLANWTAANTCAWARTGGAVWIQATYNPIFDAKGQPFKVVKFETDLTQRRAMEQELRAAKIGPSRPPRRAAPSWPT